MTSLGQDLRAEREKRGISLEEISRATRISLRFLSAIEGDRFELLPGGFFNKAILRSYAHYLGLDEKTILQRYEALFPEKLETPRKKQGELIYWPPAWRRTTVTLLILLAGVALSYFVFRSLQGRNPSVTRTPILQETLSPQPALKESAGEPPPPPITELHLRINFQQRTWIQVYADGALKLDGIRSPGTEFETTAKKEILLHLGNAGGIDYTLNGHKGKSLGRSGAVVKNIRITLENMGDFIEPEGEQPSLSPSDPPGMAQTQ